MKWGRTKFILTCLIFFSLGFNLVLPFFTKQEPVLAVSENIGYDGSGDTWVSLVSGRVRAFKDASSYAGTVSEGYAYIDRISGSPTARMAVYDSSSNLLEYSDALTVSDVEGWQKFTFSTPATLASGQDYYVAIFASDGTQVYINYSSSSGTLYYQNGQTYPTFPDPASWTSYSPQSCRLYVVNVKSYVPDWKNVTQGYLTFGNTSSYGTPSTGYFTIHNSSSFGDLNSGFFSLQNSASFQSISSGYLSFSNTSQFNLISDGWFSFASIRNWASISSGYFRLSNASSYNTLSSGWFRFEGRAWFNVTLSYAKKLYEYNTVYNSVNTIYSTYWKSQGIRVGAVGDNETFTLTDVAFSMSRLGSPAGNIIVGLRLQASDGKPTGGDLSTGTLQANTIIETIVVSNYQWYNISMTPYTLTKGTKYCIVFRVPSGDGSNYVKYWYDATTNPYLGGLLCYSSSSGSTWTTSTLRDAAFRVYGRVAGTFDHTWFTFQNTATYKSVTSGYFRLGNASSWATLTSGYFTFGAPLPAWYNINQGWLRFGNTATVHNVVSGYFSLQNLSVYQNINDGYFTLSSGVSWDTPQQGYFSFQNVSSIKLLTSGWFNLSNASSFGVVRQGWFSFAHVPAWRNIDHGYFRFLNSSHWNLLNSGWFEFQNVSNATPIPRIILPHPGATVKFSTPFLVQYSVYSSKKEPVNVSLQVIYLGQSKWINLTNQALNSNQYWLNSTIDIAMAMSMLGISTNYNNYYTLNLTATNYVTHLYADTQGNFRLRDSTYDTILLAFPLIILILFTLLAFWKQSRIILTATITTAILYATMLATSFAGTIDSWYVVLLIVYSLALSMMFFFWKGVKKEKK